MKIKRNVIFLTILPVVLGGYSLNAVAITSIQPNAPAGKSYTFAADFNYGYSDLGLYVEDSYNGGYTEYYMNLSPYINQDATSDFTVANPSISGQFTYNSSAEQTSTYAYGAYSRATYSVNNESFTLNLNSTNGEAGQVLLGEGSGGYGYKNMTVSTGISSYSGDEYQNFQVYSYGGATPNVTLTGSSLDCEFGMCVDGGSYYIDNFRPHDDPDFGINGLPELFSDIESFSFELFPSFDSVESSSDLTYQLEGASLSLRYAGHSSLPIDNTLPETLPTLAESTYGYLSLSFDTFSSDTGMYGSEVSIWDIQFTEDSPYYTDYVDYDYSAAECQVFPGCGASLYEIEKEMQLRDFFSSSYLGGYADIDYALTEFEALADGLTPDTPLLPDTDTDPEDIDEGLFEFTFDSNPTGFTFIDPDVAVGYDYEIFSGSNFISVLLPDDIGDNLFDLWLFDDVLGDFSDTGIDLTGGIAYDFDAGGVDIFRILGIETAELLDPSDPYAFITGLQFADPGAAVSMSQTAITEFVPDASSGSVPEPTALLLLLSGMTLLIRQRKA